MKVTEKKVEYVELIYDLIFVYVIGRNNALLQNFENGFVSLSTFAAYVMTTLAVIQIWNYSTYYVNIYGRNSVRDHCFMFLNMFLLYFIGEGTRMDWQSFHTQYHVAWALILINIGVQYVIEMKHHRDDPQAKTQISRMAGILFTESLIILLDIPVFQATGTTWLSLFAILFGIAAVMLFGQRRSTGFVDFMHLSERAMLYVVFSFGEMIIAIAGYFDGGFSWDSTYYALMAFLIAVALFLSYGMFYDHIIDRNLRTNGLRYMLLHIFIIFAMNNITNSLKFMRIEEIRILPKVLFITISFLMFFAFLFALGYRHAKARCRKYQSFCMKAAGIGIVFAILMIAMRSNMAVNITFSVLYVFMMFGMIYKYGINMDKGWQG